MATLFTGMNFRAFDANGNPLAGGQLFTYISGTSTPQATYTDATEGTPNANPVVLDSSGQANVFLGKGKVYKFVLQDADGVEQWTQDGIDSMGDMDDIRDAIDSLQDNDIYMCGPISLRPSPAPGVGNADCGVVYFSLKEGANLARAWRWNGTTWVEVTSTLFPKQSRSGSINYVIDGGADVPSTGVKGYVPVPAACTITGWEVLADAVGSAVIDIKRSTYANFPTTSSIAGTDKPTLTAAQKAQNLAVNAGVWTTSLSKGDVIEFNLSSVATCKRLTVTLFVTIPGE